MTASLPSPSPTAPTGPGGVHGVGLAQMVEVETPELVVLSYTIAGLGTRAAAAAIDLVALLLLIVAAMVGTAAVAANAPLGGLASSGGAWVIAIFLLLQFALFWGYHVAFELFADGRTPGKRLLGLRVVRDGGYSVDFAASAVRNLLRLIDLLPFAYFAGAISIIFSKQGKRIGDLVAGTIVVKEALVKRQATPPLSATDLLEGDGAVALLDDQELALLERWAERMPTIAAERRAALTAQVAARLRSSLPAESRLDEDALHAVLRRERDARRRGLPSRGATGAGRERYAIVASRSPRWTLFAARLAEVQRRGLRSLDESSLRDFVAEYRALSADLARLRTASRGQATDEQFHLARLVAGAHNVIYARRGAGARAATRYLWIDVPREIRRSAVPILVAAVLFFLPAVIAYTGVVREPGLAERFIPVGMQDRAEAGIRRAASGEGYIDDPTVFRPLMASRIISNNVQVTFAAFAGGVTMGIMTAVVLVMNGVSIGGVMGLYASKGIASLLLAFVAPHGVLELTAICIAGGAGFLLAAAILVPGARTRRRALAENGRRAIRLLTGTTLLLLVAGTIEGLVSPIPWWPLSAKLAVSGVTAVFLVVYLRAGRGDVQSTPRAFTSR